MLVHGDELTTFCSVAYNESSPPSARNIHLPAKRPFHELPHYQGVSLADILNTLDKARAIIESAVGDFSEDPFSRAVERQSAGRHRPGDLSPCTGVPGNEASFCRTFAPGNHRALSGQTPISPGASYDSALTEASWSGFDHNQAVVRAATCLSRQAMPR